jgi:(+)-pinoresinol hydroxylase
MRSAATIGLLLVGLASAPAAAQDVAAIQRGKEVYEYWCATCHGSGPGNPGTTALLAKYMGARPGVVEDRTDLTPQAIRFFVRSGISIMPFFRKTEVSDEDLDAMVAYLTRPRAADAGRSSKP